MEALCKHIRNDRDLIVSDEVHGSTLGIVGCGRIGQTVARRASGFGIVGMTERAALLGGTLEAGPTEPRGWRVRAVLPREDVG